MVQIENKYLSLISSKLKKFDDIVINQQDFEGIVDQEAEKKGFFLRDFGMKQWDWPQGVAIFGLHLAGQENDEYILRWANEEIEKGLPTKNVNTICPMLTLMDYPEFEKLSLEWMDWIEKDFPRTREKGLQHITSGEDKYTLKENEQQIWLDTVFMTVLFTAKMGVKYNNEKWREDATYQILLHVKYLLNRETGLFYHGWNFNEISNYGANFWCRGNSWMALGIPLFLKIMEGYLPESTNSFLKNVYNNQVLKLLELRGKDGLWHTILTDKTSYTETSGSAGIVGGILLGQLYGYLVEEIDTTDIDYMIESLEQRIDKDGIVTGVSAGTPISYNEKDYKDIVQTPMVYGQAMMIVALTIADILKMRSN